jgi:hypothetical protein
VVWRKKEALIGVDVDNIGMAHGLPAEKAGASHSADK